MSKKVNLITREKAVKKIVNLYEEVNRRVASLHISFNYDDMTRWSNHEFEDYLDEKFTGNKWIIIGSLTEALTDKKERI
jgi:hypothetical protein